MSFPNLVIAKVLDHLSPRDIYGLLVCSPYREIPMLMRRIMLYINNKGLLGKVSCYGLGMFKWYTDENGFNDIGPGYCTDVLQWYSMSESYPGDNSIIISAALHGELDVLKIIYSKYSGTSYTCPINGVFESAALGGHLDIMKWLLHIGIRGERPWGPKTFKNAALSGNLDIMKFLLNNGCLHWGDIEIFYGAASVGKIENLQWLLDNIYGGDLGSLNDIIRGLIKEGCSKEVLDWIWDHVEILPFYSDTLCLAADGGSVEIVEWLYEKGCQLSVDVFLYAAQVDRDNIDMINWLIQHRCPWNAEVFSSIVYNDFYHDNLDLLKQLRDPNGPNGVCPWDENTFACAVSWYDVGLLRWLKQEGCPWDDLTFARACGFDNASQLRSYQNDFTWKEFLKWHDSKRGNNEMMKWLYKVDCPGSHGWLYDSEYSSDSSN
jgi:hypothetical protein